MLVFNKIKLWMLHQYNKHQQILICQILVYNSLIFHKQ